MKICHKRLMSKVATMTIIWMICNFKLKRALALDSYLRPESPIGMQTTWRGVRDQGCIYDLKYFLNINNLFRMSIAALVSDLCWPEQYRYLISGSWSKAATLALTEVCLQCISSLILHSSQCSDLQGNYLSCGMQAHMITWRYVKSSPPIIASWSMYRLVLSLNEATRLTMNGQSHSAMICFSRFTCSCTVSICKFNPSRGRACTDKHRPQIHPWQCMKGEVYEGCHVEGRVIYTAPHDSWSQSLFCLTFLKQSLLVCSSRRIF